MFFLSPIRSLPLSLPLSSSGFYAADWSGGDASKGEGGETLTVVDKNEAWVFHVLGDDTGSSAVWAAQRVPDDHVAAIANQVSSKMMMKGGAALVG